MPKFLMSIENQPLFYVELVKYGVESSIAAKVARILASGLPDELLAKEDIELVQNACKQWSRQHNVTSIAE